MKIMREKKTRILPALVCLAVLFVVVEAAEAVVIDSKRSLEFIAKVQSRVSLRLQDSQGYTEPKVSVGDMVQWRNIAYLEVSHDLKYLMGSIDFLEPLRRWGVEMKYRVVGRFMYEGVYDVGPEVFQDVEDRDPDNIDSFKQAYDLWEAYGDIARGPVFFRIGRQNLSWGETDVFRLLDVINPLDNTYGGIFEDLDDRRIPLWMIRGSYNFGSVGPAASLTLEGFWVPGSWDARVAPVAPAGTPYATPLPEAPLPIYIDTPEKNMDNSRWGARVQGVLFDSVNVMVGHYKSFTDLPSTVLNEKQTGGLLPDYSLSVYYDDVQVTGGAMNWWESHLDVVVRAEAAWFWDESVFIPEVNTPLIPTGLPIPGLEALPAQGKKSEKDIFRWMVGFDKNLWIRPLNKTQTFFWSMQYFGQWIQDYDSRIKQAVPIYPNSSDYASLKEVESTFTFLTSTSYMSGQINPQIVVAYDVRGAWMFQPQVNLIREPFRFLIQYSGIYGTFTNFGFFRDRDQISFVVSYLLN